jgi:hypothetical protein
MNTERNRAKVCAQMIRAATKDLRESGIHGHFSQTQRRDNALESLDAIAEELEATTDDATPISGDGT